MLEYLLITRTLKLQCWDDHAARSWVTDLSHINDDKGRKTSGSEPQNLVFFIWRTGQLMDLLLVSSWNQKHLPGPLAKALGLAFNVLSKENWCSKEFLLFLSLPWEEQKVEECLIGIIMEDKRTEVEIINSTYGMRTIFQVRLENFIETLYLNSLTIQWSIVTHPGLLCCLGSWIESWF